MSVAATTDVRARDAIGIAAASAGMVLFAWCSHQGLPWSMAGAAGLLITASAMSWLQFGGASPASVLGLERFSRPAAMFAVAGVLIGVGAGASQRYALGIPVQPAEHLEWFVVVACLIGATEEIVYRGWLLGRGRSLGWPTTVVVAAAAHAAYKTALFAWPSVPSFLSGVDLAGIALGTFAGGIVLGVLRVTSGSLIPAVLAHIAFDFVVYASVAQAPWWVWG